MVCHRCKEELPPPLRLCLWCGTRSLEASQSKEVGRSLGRYLLTNFLWENNFGATYTGKDLLQNKTVRVMALRTELEAAAESAALVRRDGSRLQRLSHPALVPMLGANALDDGRVVLAYEDTPGLLLSEQLSGGKTLRLEALVALLRGAAEGLQALQGEGLAHGTLSPSVLLLRGAGEAGPLLRLLDVGVAYFARLGRAPVTRLETIAGPWPYLAPEIWRGDGVLDARTDVYSLACIAFRALCGQPPYMAKDAAGFMSAHHHAPVPRLPLVDGRPAASAEVEEALRKGLSKRREERFATPLLFVQRLAEASSAPPVSAPIMRPLAQAVVKASVDRPSLPQDTRPIELTQQIRHRRKNAPAAPAPSATQQRVWPLFVALFVVALAAVVGWLSLR